MPWRERSLLSHALVSTAVISWAFAQPKSTETPDAGAPGYAFSQASRTRVGPGLSSEYGDSDAVTYRCFLSAPAAGVARSWGAKPGPLDMIGTWRPCAAATPAAAAVCCGAVFMRIA